MTAAVLLFVAAWVACGWLAFGFLMGEWAHDSAAQLPRTTRDVWRPNAGFTIPFVIFSPIGLVASAVISNCGQHGLIWRPSTARRRYPRGPR